MDDTTKKTIVVIGTSAAALATAAVISGQKAAAQTIPPGNGGNQQIIVVSLDTDTKAKLQSVIDLLTDINTDIQASGSGGETSTVVNQRPLDIIVDETRCYNKGSADIPASANPYYSDPINFSNGLRMEIHMESQLDQDIKIQPVGNLRKSWQQATDIGTSITLPAYGTIDIGIWGDQWRRWVWLKITVGTSPTQGNVTADYVIQG